MGQAIQIAAKDANHDIVSVVGREGDGQGRSLIEAVAHCSPDVAIEFTHPKCGEQNVAALAEARIPVVSGTTGWDVERVRSLADNLQTPVMVDANFSIGAAVTARLVQQAAELLRAFPEFEPAIVERHHRMKIDAPSGTAKMLANRIRAGRRRDNVPVAAVRQGGQPGEHAIYFDGSAECLCVVHQTRSRSVFAIGAVRAASWLASEMPNGFVSFDEFLERIMSCSND